MRCVCGPPSFFCYCQYLTSICVHISASRYCIHHGVKQRVYQLDHLFSNCIGCLLTGRWSVRVGDTWPVWHQSVSICRNMLLHMFCLMFISNRDNWITHEGFFNLLLYWMIFCGESNKNPGTCEQWPQFLVVECDLAHLMQGANLP